MIYDDIITVEYNPLARRHKWRYIVKYWKKGKVNKKFCWYDALNITDTILGKWGQEYTGKYIWYTLSAVMSTLWEDCRNSWGYYDLRKKDSKADDDSLIIHHANFEIKKLVYNIAYHYIKKSYNAHYYHGRKYDTASFFYIHDKLMTEYRKLLDLLSKYEDLQEAYEKEYFAWCKKESMFMLITWFHKIKINDIQNFLLFQEINEENWEYNTWNPPISQKIETWETVS